jgi:hypothetical protein
MYAYKLKTSELELNIVALIEHFFKTNKMPDVL